MLLKLGRYDPGSERESVMTSTKSENKPRAESLFLEAEQYEEKGDFENAFHRLLAAAQLGHRMSQLNLGNFYASGTGVRRNLEKAAHWYKKVYKNGDSDGALNLAIDRKNEGRGRSEVIWFKKAVAMNNGDACIELAKIYNARRSGQEAAAELLRRALRMNRDDISDDAKEKAKSLLKEMASM